MHEPSHPANPYESPVCRFTLLAIGILACAAGLAAQQPAHRNPAIAMQQIAQVAAQSVPHKGVP